MRETLWTRWNRNADAFPSREAFALWRAEAPPERKTWEQLISEARGAASTLAAMGVQRGDVCGLMIRHNAMFCPIYMGISALGAIPSVLAYPNARLHKEKFVQGLRGMASRSGLRWLMTERDLEEVVRPLVSGADSTVAGLLFPLDADLAQTGAFEAAGAASDTCLLQHSSGTTGLQKAVALSHGAVLEHIAQYGTAIRVHQKDSVATWLPLYHDMGLIAAFHLPLALGIPFVQLDPFEWVSAPRLLLDAVTRERSTLCWLPNFAYNLIAMRLRDDELAEFDLRSIRMLINCSEPVRAASHDKLLSRLERCGLDRRAMSACYAMAEATFAVTQTLPDAPARVLQADRQELAQGRYWEATTVETARPCVSSGRVIPGCEVRVRGENGDFVSDDRVGELEIRTTCLFDGYMNDRDGTSRVLRDGWYSTGDYGFRHDGEHYVIGRRKDIIIVAGKNLYPEDIEDEVGRVEGVIPGRIVAFGEDDNELGTEGVAVIVETASESAAELRSLRVAILRAAMAIDVTLKHVYIAPPRWLIKSSSGKPSRSANRSRVSELDEASDRRTR